MIELSFVKIEQYQPRDQPLKTERLIRKCIYDFKSFLKSSLRASRSRKSAIGNFLEVISKGWDVTVIKKFLFQDQQKFSKFC